MDSTDSLVVNTLPIMTGDPSYSVVGIAASMPIGVWTWILSPFCFPSCTDDASCALFAFESKHHPFESKYHPLQPFAQLTGPTLRLPWVSIFSASFAETPSLPAFLTVVIDYIYMSRLHSNILLTILSSCAYTFPPPLKHCPLSVFFHTKAGFHSRCSSLNAGSFTNERSPAVLASCPGTSSMHRCCSAYDAWRTSFSHHVLRLSTSLPDTQSR